MLKIFSEPGVCLVIDEQLSHFDRRFHLHFGRFVDYNIRLAFGFVLWQTLGFHLLADTRFIGSAPVSEKLSQPQGNQRNSRNRRRLKGSS